MSSSSVLSPSFLSTPSARRATGRSCVGLGSPCNFYPRPPRGGRLPRVVLIINQLIIISIHALREEGDVSCHTIPPNKQVLFLSTPSARRATTSVDGWDSCINISIHALREEGDPAAKWQWQASIKFLSTPSARRATGADRLHCEA